MNTTGPAPKRAPPPATGMSRKPLAAAAELALAPPYTQNDPAPDDRQAAHLGDAVHADTTGAASSGDEHAAALHPHRPALLALKGLALPQVQAALAADEALSRRHDTEDFHALRVSLRRLRSLLWAYEPLIGRQLPLLWNERFKRVADIAGGTRDWDVLIESLLPQAHPSGKKPRARLHDALHACRSAASAQSRGLLASMDVPRMLGDFLNSLDAAATGANASPKLRRFAAQRIDDAARVVRKRARKACKAGVKDVLALHRTRIAVKKLRYVLEFLEPALEKRDKKRKKTLTALQTHLGHLNDIVVAQRLIDEQLAPGEAIRKPRRQLHRWLKDSTSAEAKVARKRLKPALRAV